jgi:hypothetical protein
MSMTLREDYRVPRAEAHRRLRVDLHEALAFRDEMENHDPLGTGLEQRRRRICARRLVTPRRAESALDEYGTYKAHDPKCFRERVHQLGSISIRKATGTALSTAAETGEHRKLSSTIA